MIDGKSADLSGLPKDVQCAIREHCYSREEINRAFALAMDHGKSAIAPQGAACADCGSPNTRSNTQVNATV